jgi:hypothetical protein
MSLGVPGLEDSVPLHHLALIKAKFFEHCYPLIFVNSVFHSIVPFRVILFVAIAMTESILKYEAVVRSIARDYFFDSWDFA